MTSLTIFIFSLPKNQNGSKNRKMTKQHGTTKSKKAARKASTKNNEQLSLFTKQSASFGGSLLKNAHARSARPLSSKQALHVVLKSDIATNGIHGDLRLTTKKQKIIEIIKKNIKDYGIRIHKIAIAKNHIHLLISFKSRQKYFHWVRVITGLIARLMLKAEKGKPSTLKFWTYRPFTRVIQWGRDFRNTLAYVKKNFLQAVGFIDEIPLGYALISTSD